MIVVWKAVNYSKQNYKLSGERDLRGNRRIDFESYIYVPHQQKFKTQVRNIREGSLYITNARSLLLYKSLQGLLRNAIVLPI